MAISSFAVLSFLAVLHEIKNDKTIINKSKSDFLQRC